MLPMKAYNLVTMDREIMVDALAARMEIYFTSMLLVETHDRAFKSSTTYHFHLSFFTYPRKLE